MVTIDSFSLFISATFLLAITPGPDNLFVISQSAIYNRWTGLLITLGLCSGLLVHCALVAFGLASILQESPILFTAIKLLGAAYLVYLAWQAYHAGAAHNTSKRRAHVSNLGLIRRGFIMNISNPKVAIFFLAFLPQFIDIQRGEVTTQILFLGLIFMLVTLLVFGSMACLSASLAKPFLNSRTTQLMMNKLAAAVLLSLALYMTLQTN